MKTKFVVLLSTLATATLLLIAGFAILSTVVEFTNPPVVVGACEDGYEPDDDYTTATTVTVPSLTSHNFDNADDKDWVVFSGAAGTTYTIKTMNLAISGTKYVDTKLVFYWWDGSGLVHLATRDDNGDEPYADKIIWPITTTGWYYVDVGHVEGGWSFSGCGATYDLSIILTGVPCTTTLVIEPDTLMVGGTATMTATVVDCSSSPLAGQVITFSTTSGLGSGGISPITATTDANGQAVFYISSTISGIKLVTATAPNLVAGTDTVNFTVPDGCEDDYEPDDSRAEATIVTPPNTTHHNFHDDGDVDWVGFWGTAGITYTIETLNLTTNPTATVDTVLDLYSWDGSTLTWLATHDDRDWPDDLSSIITWVVTTDGWYYVAAGRFTGSDYGCDTYYDLRITGPPAYVYLPIVMKGYCSCGPDNYEPNDSFAQAYGPLIPGQTYHSYISCCDVASRKDYFYIEINTTNPIEVDLTDIPAGVDYDLYLYNSAQAEVDRSQNDDNAPEHISHTPAGTGRYYILVFSPYSHYSDSSYSLRVTYD